MKQPAFVNVCLPVPKHMVFTYRIPSGASAKVSVGSLVWVTLGRRKLLGMVTETLVKAPEEVKDCKEVLEFLASEYTLPNSVFQLFQWAQKHYLAPPGEVFRCFLPNSLLKGQLNKGERARPSPPPELFRQKKAVVLNEDQVKSIEEISQYFESFHPCLLQGVTGSGKTEVYLELCERALKKQGSALVMVPEIALTPLLVGRFVARFPNQVGAYHSGMTESQRRQSWWKAKTGQFQILIGTRSAVTLPLKNLKILIVDEEHDASYKQEERFRYHGRDLAVVRGQIEKVPVVLGSATPSLESRENVEKKKYHFYTLKKRAQQSALPKLHLIDLKADPPNPESLLSQPLQAQLEQVIQRGEQALFFLNRRGYSPFLLCRDCSETPRCPNCEISLTFHKNPSALQCHYCEYRQEMLQKCPACQSPHLYPMGIGTEKLEEKLKEAYPHIRLARLDRDIAMSREKTEAILSSFEKGDIDLLLGTQMVTKGHDFKNLTLVGILLADQALNLPDFRAAERLFQIVTQVAGRAGRHQLPGEVFLQTFRPQHYAILSAMEQDPEKFFMIERSYRAALGYPPFGRMILIRLSGNQAKRVEVASEKIAFQLKRSLARISNLEVLGPSKAILEKLRGKYRWQILIKASKFENLRRHLANNLSKLESMLPSGVQILIDVDPVGIF